MTENFREQLANLPHYLGQHLSITVIALAVGIGISLPLAVVVAKIESLRWPVLTAAGVIQTIPSLALLALMVPLLLLVPGLAAFGFWPAVIALTLYSILPILRNTVTGIIEVDPAMTEAARGIGMTPWQTLVRVELPLAAPVILAGIRTATVWVVGIATLATPVGQTSLGNYIFSGLQTRNWTAVLFGCVAAAVLAIVLDSLIGLLESGARQRRRARLAFAGSALAVILAGGILAPSLAHWLGPAGVIGPARVMEGPDRLPLDRPLVVGAKTFTEQFILARVIEARLQAAGFRVELREGLGSTMAFDAVRSGHVDVYVEYTGTAWANYMARSDVGEDWRVLDILRGWMAEVHGIRVLGDLGFENAYALAMRRAQAEALGIATIADLAGHAPAMRIGGDYEFFNRPEWFRVRDDYGLRFAQAVSYDPAFMYQAVAEGEVDVIGAFSSDGRITAFDLVVLEDTRHAFPPYDAVLFLSPEAANHPPIVEALRPLLQRIDVEMMRHANQLVDVEGRTTREAAQWLGGAALGLRPPGARDD
jgi:osmoprotectant transport system permease protein